MSKADKYFLAFWFLLNIMIGLFIVHDFGISYDEPAYYLYAQNTVDAYKSFFALAYTPAFGPHDLPNYGPAFIIFPELAVRFLKLIFPNIQTADVWHFSYFLQPLKIKALSLPRFTAKQSLPYLRLPQLLLAVIKQLSP